MSSRAPHVKLFTFNSNRVDNWIFSRQHLVPRFITNWHIVFPLAHLKRSFTFACCCMMLCTTVVEAQFLFTVGFPAFLFRSHFLTFIALMAFWDIINRLWCWISLAVAPLSLCWLLDLVLLGYDLFILSSFVNASKSIVHSSL